MNFSSDFSNRSSVAIVLLNWNGWRDTLDCLKSIESLYFQDFKVFVVDNGSTDDSIARIQLAYPSIEILFVGYNAGFAVGNNIGIRVALERGIKYVWLLNNDTVVAPESLTALFEAAQESNVGIVGSILMDAYKPSQIQAWGGGRLNSWLGTTDLFQERPTISIDHIVGASMFIPTHVFRKAGLLCEHFFFYLEDTEFSVRVRDNGFVLKVAENSKIFHKGGSSVNNGSRNRSLTSDIYFSHSNGVYLGLNAGMKTLIALPVRFFGVAINRILRKQGNRIIEIWINLIKGFILGFRNRNSFRDSSQLDFKPTE
jgi:GT2 family glycosyltransferase